MKRYRLTWTLTGMVVGLCVLQNCPLDAAKRPNLLYIVTDQQSAHMMSCAGNPYLKTPAMDSLAAAGCRFDLAYCANPVCLPSRVTMMTGHYPGRYGIGYNHDGRKGIAPEAIRQSLGWIFRKAGYETVYGGKTHWPRGMTVESIGFDNLSSNQREGLAEACVEFLKKERDKPFFMVASFINPHDICYMAIDDHAKAQGRAPLYSHSKTERERLARSLAMPDGVSREDFFRKHCPPLPENYEVPALEPERITEYLSQFPFKKYVRENWSDERWRQHRWAYCRLTEMVDAHIAVLLKGLREAGLEESTVIVFSSDHGDMDASHRLEHKMVLYEEACRVPFIVSYKGVTKAGLVDRTHLVSAGIDLIPTLCDYAGIDPPAGLPGRSVRALAEGHAPADWRDELVVETGMGRMLRTARFKYNVYESGAHREQLIDLEKDRGEMVNLAEDPDCAEALRDHRARLRQWVDRYGDETGKGYMLE
jgi:choline-sulfatase